MKERRGRGEGKKEGEGRGKGKGVGRGCPAMTWALRHWRMAAANSSDEPACILLNSLWSHDETL